MNEAQVKNLQNELNHFTTKNPSLGFTRLVLDGKPGPLTKKRLRHIKYLLGYSHENMKHFSADRNFYRRLNAPTRVNDNWGQTKLAVKNGKKRRRARRVWVRRNKVKAFLKPGVGTFDGKPVAKCAIPILTWCRANGWHGQLVSGWRDPKYSQHLCQMMCGRPSCPGKCAGLSSNHVGNTPAKFAMDVSDYVNFGHVVARCPIKPHVHNALPNDLVHFSPSGR